MEPMTHLGAALILFLMGMAGAFGGILDVLQIIDIRKLIEKFDPALTSRKRFFAALLLGALGGIGGAVAMLFIMVATAKLKTDDTVENKLLLISLGMVSGFLGYRVLRSVAQRVERQIQELEERTEKKIEENQAAVVQLTEHRLEQNRNIIKADLEYSEAISKGLLVANSEEPPPQHAIEEGIAALERIVKRTPNDRQANIILANIYARSEDYEAAIRILTQLIEVLQTEGEARRNDIGDALYNRACMTNLIIKGLPKDSPQRVELKNQLYRDLEDSFNLSPSNRNEAQTDPDLQDLTHEEKFKKLIA